ncbi:MAG TPA: SRPBCC family protein [Gemmatimonadaceae bacterium]|nr:SRPBCC family protein [Gemmatimonadaceae bacterium]
MLTWLLRIVIGLVVLVAIVLVVGYALPKGHTATRTAHVPQPPELVWATITDFPNFPAWRKGVKSVEVLPTQNGQRSWRETTSDGVITYVTEAWDPPNHFVSRIADKNLPYGGSWDYSISPNATGSTVTITEQGEVYNPVFRVVSRFMSQTATMDTYLAELAGKLGGSYTPSG